MFKSNFIHVASNENLQNFATESGDDMSNYHTNYWNLFILFLFDKCLERNVFSDTKWTIIKTYHIA